MSKYICFETVCNVSILLLSLELPLWFYNKTNNPGLGDGILVDSCDSWGSKKKVCHPWLRSGDRPFFPQPPPETLKSNRFPGHPCDHNFCILKSYNNKRIID